MILACVGYLGLALADPASGPSPEPLGDREAEATASASDDTRGRQSTHLTPRWTVDLGLGVGQVLGLAYNSNQPSVGVLPTLSWRANRWLSVTARLPLQHLLLRGDLRPRDRGALVLFALAGVDLNVREAGRIFRPTLGASIGYGRIAARVRSPSSTVTTREQGLGVGAHSGLWIGPPAKAWALGLTTSAIWLFEGDACTQVEPHGWNLCTQQSGRTAGTMKVMVANQLSLRWRFE